MTTWINTRNQVQLRNSRTGQSSTNFEKPTTSKWSYKISNPIYKTNKVVLQNQITDRITRPCEEGNEISKILYQLVKEQSAPSVDIEAFDGNPLYCTYFRSMFWEAVQKRTEDPEGKLTHFINLTRKEVKELVKLFIHDRPTSCWSM